MAEVRRFAARRRPGARHLQRLPGALRGRPAARRAAAERLAAFVCRQVGLEVVNADTAFTRACAPGERCRSRSSTPRGRCYAPEPLLDEWRARPGRAALRRRRRTRTARTNDIAGVSQRRRQRVGPDAAPRARGRPADRPADGLQLLDASRAEPPSLPVRRHAAGSSASPTTSTSGSWRSSGASRTTPSWRCTRSCGASTAPTSTRQAAAHAADRGPAVVLGPGRERRRGRRRRRAARCAFKVESHNHPSARWSRSRARPPASAGSCATSSRWARGRSRCSTRCGSASSTVRALALPVRAARSRASATTATASACRRSAARSTSRRPTRRTAWSTRCASAWRRASG